MRDCYDPTPVCVGSRDEALRLMAYSQSLGIHDLQAEDHQASGACGGGGTIGYHGWWLVHPSGLRLTRGDIEAAEEAWNRSGEL